MLQVISDVNRLVRSADGWNLAPNPRPPSRAGASHPLTAGAMAYYTGLVLGSEPWLAVIAFGDVGIKGVADGHGLITHPNLPSREGKGNEFEVR